MRKMRLNLPFPISVNQMYGQNRNKKDGTVGRYTMKKYVAWKDEALEMLTTQNITYLKRRVDIEIWLNGGHPNSDCDNFCKCILDFLVKQKIIFDDKKAYVRSVKIQWTLDIEKSATVEITEIENER